MTVSESRRKVQAGDRKFQCLWLLSRMFEGKFTVRASRERRVSAKGLLDPESGVVP